MSDEVGRQVPSWNAEAGGRLRQVLRSLGTMTDAAKIADRTKGTLHTYLNGKPPPRSVIDRIADAANVSPGWIITGEGPMRPEIVRQPLTDAMAGHLSAILAEIEDEDILRLCGVDRPAVQAQIDERSIAPGFVLALLQFSGVPLGSPGTAATSATAIPTVPPPSKHGAVPVITLRETGIEHWYTPEELEQKTERPGILLAPDGFCIIVRDSTLQARGLRAGAKVFADPLLNYQVDDIVYVETLIDGQVAAALRLVDAMYDDTLNLSYWTPVGAEMAYVRVPLRYDQIHRIAVISLIRTRV